MKKVYLLAAILLLACKAFAQDGKKTLQKLVETQLIKGQTFEKLDLILLDKTTQKPSIDKVFREANFYQLSKAALKTVSEKQPEKLALDLQTTKGNLQLQLLRHQVLTNDFVLKTSTEENSIDYKPGQYYRGIVQGQPNSVVALSIFDKEIVGIISQPQEGKFILGKMQDKNNDLHIGYYQDDLLVEPNLSCGTEEPTYSRSEIQNLQELANTVSSYRVDNCVNVYLELEHDLVTEKGGATGAANFITGLYNVVATLYQNENITTQISEIFAWESPDNYPSGTSTVEALYAFRTARPNYNGDLAHLISRGAPAGGGVAFLNGLCNSYGYAYSYIYSSYNQYPTYSWSVEVLAHEMGHNLGSPHTHNCSWTGGAIDGCGPEAGYSEGCDAALPSQGTIMSYCHLVSGVGIGFEFGFGPQPGNLIRNNIANASCLSPCEVCLTDLVLSGNENGTQIHEASNSITSTQVLSTTANITYNAGASVLLNPGFIANAGSDFHAYIAACNSNLSNENQAEAQATAENGAVENALSSQAGKYSFRSYPNPFSQVTRLEYTLAADGPVTLAITDLTGRLVKLLVNDNQVGGAYNLTFNASELPAGMYLARLQVNDQVETIKLLLMNH